MIRADSTEVISHGVLVMNQYCTDSVYDCSRTWPNLGWFLE